MLARYSEAIWTYNEVRFVKTCEVNNISGMYEDGKTPVDQTCFTNPWVKQDLENHRAKKCNTIQSQD